MDDFLSVKKRQLGGIGGLFRQEWGKSNVGAFLSSGHCDAKEKHSTECTTEEMSQSRRKVKTRERGCIHPRWPPGTEKQGSKQGFLGKKKTKEGTIRVKDRVFNLIMVYPGGGNPLQEVPTRGEKVLREESPLKKTGLPLDRGVTGSVKKRRDHKTVANHREG